MSIKNKELSRKRRHRSLRKSIEGSLAKPRLVVFRSAKHIYAQIVDDSSNNTIVSASDLLPKKNPANVQMDGNKKDRAKKVGFLVAQKCAEKGISQVVFDRAGYRYHGRVSMVAAGAREGGLKF